jgi:AcrR family transcriptional regulator
MDTNPTLLAIAERLFYEHGYMATNMDTLARAAKMSSRTLYKHAGSKAALVGEVLAMRDLRFFEQVDGLDVRALFDALGGWIGHEGARGCLFLRILGETGGAEPAIVAAVLDHKARLRRHVARIVQVDLGRADDVLAERIVLLFEGAVAASAWQGMAAIDAACGAALDLVAGARRA